MAPRPDEAALDIDEVKQLGTAAAIVVLGERMDSQHRQVIERLDRIDSRLDAVKVKADEQDSRIGKVEGRMKEVAVASGFAGSLLGWGVAHWRWLFDWMSKRG